MARQREDFHLAAATAQASALLLDENDLLPPNPRDLTKAPRGHARDSFLRRRAATRRLVAERLGVAPGEVDVGRDSSGAPRLLRPDAGLYLSVSGRDDFCAIALASTPVGVDIEPLEPTTEPVWSALDPHETARLRALPEDVQGEVFLRLWTAKEAYLKARGSGLSRDPATIAVDLDFRLVVEGTELRAVVGEWRVIELASRKFLIACVVLGEAKSGNAPNARPMAFD